MSIVKIHLYRASNQKEQKYLLTYIQGLHYTVREFLLFAIKALDIQASIDDIIVEHNGYVIPQCLDGSIVSKSQILTLKVKNTHKASPPLGYWTAQQIAENKNELLNQVEDDLQSSSTPKFSQNGLNGTNLTYEFEKQKQKNKKKRNQINQEQEEISQQQQNLTQQYRQKNKKEIDKKQKKEKKHKRKISESQQSDEQELPRIPESKKDKKQKKKQQKQKKRVNQKRRKVVQQEEMEQQEEVQENLKDLKVSKFQSFGKPQMNRFHQKQTAKQNKSKEKQNRQQKEQNKTQLRQKQTHEVKQKPKPQNYSQKRKIIQVDIQSSDESSQDHNKKPFVKKNNMIPPSVRNKIGQGAKPKPSFKDYQQQQWITITKQILQKHSKQRKQGETFLQKNNLIKFKEIQLDMQRFIPVTSEWIEATVQNAESDGKLKLNKVTQLGKEYREYYEIHDYNMVELQINKNFATKQQLELMDNKVSKQASNSQSLVVKEVVNQSQNKKNFQQEKCSLQKFICGQVNFYFSDKNYPTDLFMQMHANNNPQKWIPIRFLLNFGKIKKVLKDQNKLVSFLIEDQKRAQRNFQINEDTRMIRKKQPILEKILNQNNQNQEQQRQ